MSGHPPPGPLSPDAPDLIPARMLSEFAYCPRAAYLEWVQGEFEDSVDTVEGKFQHRRVDIDPGRAPFPQDAETSDVIHARSVTLSAPDAGIVARIDLLELQGPLATPVDYKHGPMPDQPWEPVRVQLCAHAIVLRENGYQSDHGVIYYVESRSRVAVEFSEALTRRTLDLATSLRETVLAGRIPAPLVDSPKCPRCSLVGICLPDETNLLSMEPSDAGEIRRLTPARDDALPVYVQEQGASVGKHGEVLQIRQGNKTVSEVRLIDVAQVSLFGNVQITTQAVKELAARNIPISHFTYGGWFVALTQGMSHKNVELRIKQYQFALDPAEALKLSRWFVNGKIRNSRTLLRRNHREAPPDALTELSRLGNRALRVRAAASLLGLEGLAARVYFANFPGMLKTAENGFDFTARNRRPPRDPVNAVLSFLYALMVRELTAVTLRVGFDPYLGFYHRPRYGRPALALDLAEEFRPLVGDSVTLTLFNGGELKQRDFVTRAAGVALTPRARKQVLEAYERRMDTLITHPVFGYTISYRRVLEIQARLLARYLLGEIPEYPAFTTR